MVLKYTNNRQQSHLILTTTEKYVDHTAENGFKIIWNQSGIFRGLIDNTEVVIREHEVLTLAPNQQLEVLEPGEGVIFQYNRDFYCILDHDQEVGCVGLLYYGSRQNPIIRLSAENQRKFGLLLEVFKDEFATRDNIQEEMLQMLLKRLIILCTRLLKEQKDITGSQHQLDLIRRFHVLVEMHFRDKQKVADYAEMLHKSPKTLANLFAQHREPSPLRQVHERIALEAKRLLLFTDQSIKEVGFELNFQEEAHFSRFFKRVVGVSPSAFREGKGTLGEAKNPVVSKR
jgi:AraC family transcriptional regulator, transcriptional activator of pobA